MPKFLQEISNFKLIFFALVMIKISVHKSVKIKPWITDRGFNDGRLIKFFSLDDDSSETFPRS